MPRANRATAPAGGAALAAAVRAASVSVLVVTYNGAAWIRDCLRSVLDQTAAHDEVIVIDNRSTDDTLALARAEFPEVRVVEMGENLGYGGAMNVGAELARGTYLLILNQDALLGPGCLAALVRALEETPAAALATAKVLLREQPDRINTCANEVHFTGITVCRGLGEPAERFDRREEVLAVSGAAVLVRSAIFRALGGFDARFFMYLEDTDLSLRAALAGQPSLFVPDARVYHRFVSRFPSEKVFYLERNRYAMLLKLYRWRTLACLLPALLLAEAVTWGFAAVSGPRHLRAKARAYAWAWAHRRTILAERRATQARRVLPDRALLARCTPYLAFDQAAAGPLARLAERAFNLPFAALYALLRRIIRW